MMTALLYPSLFLETGVYFSFPLETFEFSVNIFMILKNFVILKFLGEICTGVPGENCQCVCESVCPGSWSLNTGDNVSDPDTRVDHCQSQADQGEDEDVDVVTDDAADEEAKHCPHGEGCLREGFKKIS